MKSFPIKRKKFLNDLSTYVNGGCFTRTDSLISILFPPFPFKKNAKKVIHRFESLLEFIHKDFSNQTKIHIERYKGNNNHVLKMGRFLSMNLKEDLYGAYVHGSLGSCDEVAYSDFDALVILRNDVFKTSKRLSRVAYDLNKARSIMYEFDPLQHHGWFVLTEADLENYPEFYFPIDIFRHAKSLFMDKGLALTIFVRNISIEARERFENSVKKMIKKIDLQDYPKNIYQLKCLLSHFMLFPALYLHAKNGAGINKKDSFELARKDFDEKNWAIMDTVSGLRNRWNYELDPMKKWLISHSNVYRWLVRRGFFLNIPVGFEEKLDTEFYMDMKRLTQLMLNNIEE